jgi:hypothetical protein
LRLLLLLLSLSLFLLPSPPLLHLGSVPRFFRLLLPLLKGVCFFPLGDVPFLKLYSA